MRNEILKSLKMLMVVCAIGLIAVFVLNCGGSSGGGNDGTDNAGQSLTITGESENQVSLNGTWDSGCDEMDGGSIKYVTTISGSTFVQNQNEWHGPITCDGMSDIELKFSGTLVLGNEVTTEMGGLDVTATELDLVMTSIKGTINNPAKIVDFNANENCGFDDWVVSIPKELLGTTCFPDSDEKDVLYIDDTANPDVMYKGEEEGSVDASGYPTEIELDNPQERM